MTNINKEILRLAIPSILANITIPLVGIVDTSIVGHLSDAAAIGGIAIGTMLFDLLYWNFAFLRLGTSGLTAQALGRMASGREQSFGVPDECAKIFDRSITLASISAVFVWAIQWFFVTLVLAILPCSPEVASVARDYFFVRVIAAPATLSLMAFKGWFIGMQDTRSPMAVDILVNVLNIIASYALAVYTPLGVVGVAWGTVIAQYAGLVLAIILLARRYPDVWAQCHKSRALREAIQWDEMRRMMKLNGNLFIRSLCFMVVYVGFTILASTYGDAELAVSSMLMKLFLFFSYFVDGFAYAGEALVGKAFGRIASGGEQSSIGPVVRSLFNWCIWVGLLFTAIYALWGGECMELMTNDRTVLDAVRPYMGWLIAMPLMSALAFMWDGVYVGATAGVEIRNAMIWAAAGFIVLYVLTYRFVGAQALYIAYFAHLAARVVYLTIKWKKVVKFEI